MKKIISIICLFSFLSSCGKASSDEIPIGVLAPMTGILASVNEFAVNGLELALEEINKDGVKGKKLNLLYEDIDLCLPKKSVDSTRKLISIDKVPVIMSVICGGNQIMATHEITEKEKIIHFSSSAVIEKISNIGDYIFRNIVSNEDELDFLVDYVINTLGKKKFFTIYINTEWGHSYKNSAKKAILKHGGEYIGEAEAELLEKDYKTFISQAKQSEADVIFINVANGSPTGLLLKQATELGLNRQIIASYNVITPDTVKFAENAAEGVIFPYPKVPDTEKARSFRARYKEKYGIESEIHAANSYDALHLIADMLDACDKDTYCIKDKLYSMETYKGVGGDFKFDKNGDVHKEFEIWTVKDGKRQATGP